MERHDELRIHVVQKGETIRMIAMQEFGDVERYREIMEMNDLPSEEILAGQILNLPEFNIGNNVS